MILPRSTGTYRVIHPSEFTEEQRLVLLRVRRERGHERLCVLLGDDASTIQRKYGALTTEVGDA